MLSTMSGTIKCIAYSLNIQRNIRCYGLHYAVPHECHNLLATSPTQCHKIINLVEGTRDHKMRCQLLPPKYIAEFSSRPNFSAYAIFPQKDNS